MVILLLRMFPLGILQLLPLMVGNTLAITSTDGFGIDRRAGDEFCFTAKEGCDVTSMYCSLSLMI